MLLVVVVRLLAPVLPRVLGLVAHESAGERAQDAVVGLAADVVAADAAGDGAHQAAVALLAVGVVRVAVGVVRVVALLAVLAVLVALRLAGGGGPGFLLRGVVGVALGLAAGRVVC